MTNTISSYLTRDHRRYDHLLSACESAVSKRVWQAADEAAAGLRDAMHRHFALEEDLLFPEVERASPMAGGPTSIMRMEHEQMRQLLADLGQAIRDRDSDTCIGELETLHFLNQQHNAKEEGILYPLADNSLSGSTETLLERMRDA